MGKKRQTRAGPKCSKVVEPDDSEDSTEPAPKKNGKNKETSKEPDETHTEDPLKNGSGSEQEDPLITSRVSSPTHEEFKKDSADGEKRKDSDKSETEGEKVTSELNGKIDIPKEKVVSEGENDEEDTPSVKDKDTLIDSEKEEFSTPPESEKFSTPPTNDEETSKESEKDKDLATREEENDKENEAEPTKLGLRLVPLTQLLKPEVLVKPTNEKPKFVRKTTPRVTKSTSYIEISSDSEEVDQISLSSTDDEIITKKTKSKRVRDAGSSKENKSTNNNLSNGGSKRINFKEPMSPTKYMKKGQDLLVNLEKMPNNINKLMKCYRVDEELSRIESWSETDDFENMISTSKIDRNAPEKSKQETKKSALKANDVASSSKRSRKVKSDTNSDSDSNSDSKEVGKRSEKTSISKRSKKVRNESHSEDEFELKAVDSRRQRSERKSAVEAKLRNKTVIEKDEKNLSSGSSSDKDDVIPLKSTRDVKKSEPIASTSKSTKKARQTAMTSENNSESEPVTKKSRSKAKKVASTDSDSSEKKLFKIKLKKKSHKDDHGQEKAKLKRRDKSSSSEDEERAAPSKSKAKQTKENQQKSTRSKDSSKETGTRSSPRKSKGKKTKASNSSGNDNSGLSSDEEDNKSHKSSISVKSSLSDDEGNMDPIKLGNSPVKRTSISESEVESSTSTGQEKKTKSSDLSDSEDEKEEPTIVDQKLRNRNKFESNSCFQKLKEKIEQRKIKRKANDNRQRNGKVIKKKFETNNNESESETATSPAHEESDASSTVMSFHLNFHIFINFLHRGKHLKLS